MQTLQNIILIGLGKVGREVINLIQQNHINVQFVAVADSQACLIGKPLSAELLEKATRLKSQGEKISGIAESQPLRALEDQFLPNTIVLDTSAARGLDWQKALDNECKLVFANKNTLSEPWSKASRFYNQLHIRYESAVGAGLPVIETLRSMVASGDTISHIQGVMSGTLGYLCSQLEAGVIYSQAVQQAYDAGYTEPDPRDDLSGFDVLRKALILGRTAGWQLEQTDFEVEPLYDEHLLGNSVDEFLKNSSMLDRSYSRQVEAAAAQGNVLRYLATVSPDGGESGLKAVQRNSSLGALQGPGNYFAIYSQRYNQIPLVIAGPGAGITVTANGVLNDIIALLNC
ncbi:MAG TPA: hypothetical protein VK856_07705 [Anaerolineaceae bacterium]|nr:hypothetical protein [Anaerolineaceae bacterium]